MPTPTPLRRAPVTLGAVLLLGSAAACSSTATAAKPSASATPSADPTSKASIALNVESGADTVPVSKLVRVRATDGVLSEVSVTTPRGQRIRGDLTADKSAWVARERLEPGVRYRVVATALDADGLETASRVRFRTQKLTLDQQAYPTIAPLQGQTVGVGFPVMISFDKPVKNKRLFERHMAVRSSAGQRGSFHWLSDTQVHYRPRTYWQPGSKITIDVNVNGLPTGLGTYGQEDRRIVFHVGRSLIARVNARAHTMQVFIGGKLVRTLPVTTGQAGMETRSGIKVIIEKYRSKRMDAATTGVAEDDPNYYNIDNVEYAQRVTYSGEFIHAAPWSLGSQGRANVSHGCTGMSTADAAWLYGQTQPGDVISYTGTGRYMTLTNGYGDWNMNWQQWKAGSALS